MNLGALLAFSGHAEGMGIGNSRIPVSRTQPTGSGSRAKATGRLAAGGATNDFSPQRKRTPTSAHRSCGGGKLHSSASTPLTLQRSGTVVWARRPAETRAVPTATTSASSKRGARPLGVPTGMDNGQGRGIGVDTGVQHVKPRAALAAIERLCHVPHGSSVCLYRLHVFDGRQDGRKSGSHPLFAHGLGCAARYRWVKSKPLYRTQAIASKMGSRG